MSERIIEIHNTVMGQRIDWLETTEKESDPICSARLRFDGEWGFQCRCGNNDLWTDQESRVVVNKVSPTAREINEIVSNLEPAHTQRFTLVAE